jgi:hypothetical protein
LSAQQETARSVNIGRHSTKEDCHVSPDRRDHLGYCVNFSFGPLYTPSETDCPNEKFTVDLWGFPIESVGRGAAFLVRGSYNGQWNNGACTFTTNCKRSDNHIFRRLRLGMSAMLNGQQLPVSVISIPAPAGDAESALALPALQPVDCSGKYDILQLYDTDYLKFESGHELCFAYPPAGQVYGADLDSYRRWHLNRHWFTWSGAVDGFCSLNTSKIARTITLTGTRPDGTPTSVTISSPIGGSGCDDLKGDANMFPISGNPGDASYFSYITVQSGS